MDTQPAKLSVPSGAFVMRRIANFDPEFVEHVNCYDEAVETMDVTHPDGLRRRTVIIHQENSRQRLLCLGQWEDVTELHTKAAPSIDPDAPAAKAKRR